MELIIGDKAWSSWSLRPWLALKRTGAPFTETLIALRQADTAERIRAAGSPSSKVPALIDGDLVVWDSLAICEHLAERFPSAQLWPQDRRLRSLARAAACEMHAGFTAIRQELSMDVKARLSVQPSPACADDIRRIVALWRDLRRQAGEGPWLLGAWSIADAFFAPVATRFQTYGIDLAAYGDEGPAAAYQETALNDPDLQAWIAAA